MTSPSFAVAASGVLGAFLLVRRARRRRAARAARDYQYSPSQWSHRLRGSPTADADAPFGTPDDVVMDHCATVAEGSAAVRAELRDDRAELGLPHSADTGAASSEATVDIFYRAPRADDFMFSKLGTVL